MLSPITSAPANLGRSIFFDLPPKQNLHSQSDLLKGIESLGKNLRGLAQDADLDKRFIPFHEAFFRCIEAINQAPDHDHVSDLFGSGTTNKEENLYLLMTAVDSANVSNDTKMSLLDVLNTELASSKGTDSYFNKVQNIEKRIKSSAVAGMSVLSPSNRTHTLDIKDQKFNIENTVGMKNNCLAYALRSDNSPLPDDYRSKIFTSANIENQLNRLVGQHGQNVRSNSKGDTTTDLDLAKVQVTAGYDITIPENVKSIKALSEVLATHIQQTNCFLDSAIAGGVFAKEYKQPIVIVSKNTVGASVFYVLNTNGELIHQGNDLGKLNAELNNAKYIFNRVGVHFERMVPVTSYSVLSQ